MSRLAKKPVLILSGVTVIKDGHLLVIKGPLGEKKLKILPFIDADLQKNEVYIHTQSNTKQAQANIGTMWSLLRNAVSGVSSGFSKVLEIEGIGFKANLEGKTLVLSLGFVNPIRYPSPDGILINVEKNQIKISGIDKELVGRVAAEIRNFKKPEPYKGKGIHYQGEVIRRKAGKKAATTT